MTRTSTEIRAPLLSRLLPLLFAVLQILTPLLPQLGFGRPIGDQSDDVRTLITPAGWAFSIWGLLYAGSLVFAVYQALPAVRRNELLARIRLPAAGAFLGNALWAAYTQLFGLSLVSVAIILFTLVCLLSVYRTFAASDRAFSGSERWCVVLPLSALASWLTVASIVNVAASLRFHGVDLGEAAPLMAAAVLTVAGVIAAAALRGGHGNPAYAVVFLWALSAVYAAGGQRSGAVAAGVGIAALLVLGAAIWGLRHGGIRHWMRGSESDSD
jgi:hypothetical protein